MLYVVLRFSMKIETISYVKKNAATLDLSEPILVTKNGEPVFTIDSYEIYRCRENAVALLKLLTLSEEDRAGGHLLSKDQLLTGLM